MRWSVGIGALAALSWAAPALAAEEAITFDGEVPEEGDYFYLDFDVPEGTVEIEVVHDDLAEANILDWGLWDPDGMRGWGGGNVENAIVGEEAASRSYLAGPLPAGQWRVEVGKAKIEETPALYHVEVYLRDVATLPPQPERQPYQPVVLSQQARWYAGDFHVHSRDSGDARPPLEEIATFARGRGLDFVEISDHNTRAQLDFFAAAQAEHDDFLFVPGVEYTTYFGHANGIGATEYVPHQIGEPGVGIEAAADAFDEQDALLSINHPLFDLGNLCIGCAWKHDLPFERVAAVEVATGSYTISGFLFAEDTIAYWDELCAEGLHIAAIGGSDDHRAGIETGMFQSPIGGPTTMVFADELSSAGILEAIRQGRTVVKLESPDDPMIELSSSVAPEGDTVKAAELTLRAVVTGGAGAEMRFVQAGVPLDEVAVTSDPFVHEVTVVPPASGQERWRVELFVDGNIRTVTSHVWLETGPAIPKDDGCGCRIVGNASGRGAALVFLVALALLRRRLAS